MTLKIFGYSKNELIGKHYKILFSPDFQFSENKQHFETICFSKAGEGIPVSVNISLLTGEHGERVCVIHDISERKKIENELSSRNTELAAVNKELEAFSYSVSHDLRAPLRGVDGFSQALIEDLGPKLDEESKRYLSRIRHGVQKMGTLIDDMLKLSKLTRTEILLKPMDLSAIAKDIFEDLKSEYPARKVDFVVSERMGVNADPVMLKILLENLIGNALKYTSKVEQAKIELKSVHKDGKDWFVIKDNGAGFDMAYASKLFGVFQRLHRDDEFPGTGVGLATVYRIIQKHGGEITAESQVDNGASFFFHFGS